MSWTLFQFRQSLCRSTAPWRCRFGIALLALHLHCAAHAETHALIVAGLGGEADYAAAFTAQAEAAANHARAAGVQVSLLTGDAATRAGIAEAIAALAQSTTAADAVVVQLIGHGSWDDEHFRFNVPGPDPTAIDLAGWLEPVVAKRQLAIVATSASGAAIGAMRRAGRAMITATRDGREKNAVMFGGFWSEALADPRADADKNGRISATEAFDFAAQAVTDYYASRQRIATEHPRIDGDADGFDVAKTADHDHDDDFGDFANADPNVVRLVRRVDELTQAIDELKAGRNALDEDDYFTRLQSLLMELAGVERQLQDQRSDSAASGP